VVLLLLLVERQWLVVASGSSTLVVVVVRYFFGFAKGTKNKTTTASNFKEQHWSQRGQAANCC
jgi:hypothetical protein